MPFFDDKQEVLKVELTTYGRFLLSRGKFKPAYYAFFDDDVVYDAEYANLFESQNSVQTRILEESLSLKPQTTFTGVENNVKIQTLLQREIETLKQEESQISADRNYALSLPLANSSISSDYAPAWDLRMVNGKIGNIEQTIDNSAGDQDILQPFLKHPQITLEDNVYDIKKTPDYASVPGGYKPIFTFTSGSQEVIFSSNDSPVIIDLKELNVDDLSKNFDIEIFVEETAKIAGTNSTKTVYRQLFFKKDPITIENNILLDEPKTFNVEEDESFVEHYFEVTVDAEIDLPPEQKVIANPYATRNKKSPFGVDC
jgi:hypothetical protein